VEGDGRTEAGGGVGGGTHLPLRLSAAHSLRSACGRQATLSDSRVRLCSALNIWTNFWPFALSCENARLGADLRGFLHFLVGTEVLSKVAEWILYSSCASEHPLLSASTLFECVFFMLSERVEFHPYMQFKSGFSAAKLSSSRVL
jgi:hypothetical protein